MLMDVGLEMAGLWTNTPATRVATGLVFGVVAGGVLVASFGYQRVNV
jgi:hypothetical protein